VSFSHEEKSGCAGERGRFFDEFQKSYVYVPWFGVEFVGEQFRYDVVNVQDDSRTHELGIPGRKY